MKIQNKLKYIVIAIGLSTSFVACDSYLEEENKSAVTAENYYTSDNAIELVNAVYTAVREPYTFYSEAFFGTDIFTQNGQLFSINNLNEYTNIASADGAGPWYSNYSVVSAANIAINRYENQISWEPALVGQRDLGIAQAKALRALAYFNLVQQYGGVVIYLDEVSEIRYDYARSSEEETFNQIIKDLEDAIPVLETTPAEFGRFSRRAAQHLLADVYLTKGYTNFGTTQDFETAAQLAETAIGSYDIRSQSYAQVFDFDNQINPEVLFSIQYGSEGVNNRSNDKNGIFMNVAHNYAGISRTANPYGEPSFLGMPTDFFYSLFEDNDSRDEVTLHRVLYATVNSSISENGVENITVGDTVVYYPKTALPQTELQDKLNRYWVFQPSDYGFDVADNVSGALYQYSNNLNNVNFPIFAKFDERAQDGNGYRDVFVFRLAETHLIAAEAYLGADNVTAALPHINRVRERATGVQNHYTNLTIDDILNERALELAGESNRWNVLKRTGKLQERVLMYNPHFIDHGSFDPEKHTVRPIPSQEIELSDGSLEQNPKY
ncbi:RagB/SusD family nutrient uptake outer membrane protein [Algibacter pectinivorans]|uniref:Starch-binding associating with outer membrane n=1 Tax=Algibacter pectinivorans TaxID=870482 RepID=A0A1I1M498_9FLAO|nr:RagB/SusD family nutrient uptake outer membrane protein [Algibacter pectinivorans]SFC80184.1 Starch-binding associating with outer membrane [Algibacter pectinivorans]